MSALGGGMSALTNQELFHDAKSSVSSLGLATEATSRLNKLAAENFLIDKLPIDDQLPDTPIDTGFVDDWDIRVAVRSLLAYNISLGLFPVVYEGENDGRLIRHVVMRSGFAEKRSSHGGKVSFLPHSDNPDLHIPGERLYGIGPSSPKTLSLLTLRQQDGVYELDFFVEHTPGLE